MKPEDRVLFIELAHTTEVTLEALVSSAQNRRRSLQARYVGMTKLQALRATQLEARALRELANEIEKSIEHLTETKDDGQDTK